MDMSQAIIPKSDQINADDLISGPITIKIREVNVKASPEQPVSIYFEGSDKAYRPCKSMCRVMVSAWGPDTSAYIGRSMTLYCDPKVKWGGMEVGGIRISHLSHIDAAVTMALTITRANKKPYTVKPLAVAKPATNGAPADEDIIAELTTLVKRADFAGARDMARFIKDEALRDSTIKRIDGAENNYKAKHSPVPPLEP